MGKVKEREAVDSLLTMLGKFLKTSGKEREDLAKDIDDIASFDLMEYNAAYEGFSEDFKELLDSLFLMHKWKGRGIYYGKELFFGVKDIKSLVKSLKNLKSEM